MRVILVGTPRQRQQLREQVELGMDVVAEFDSLAAARQSGPAADAMLLPPPGRRRAEADETLPETLTPREIDVLELVAEGLPNKAIAERLGISDQTVKFHIASITGKLGASNRTDVVRRAVRGGLLTL
jgi:DNA-binding NarL/FixJ family response regulator